jgi:phage terminase small subunit
MGAGYSSKTARQMGYENLTKPYIQRAIERQARERDKRIEIKADDVLRELMLIVDSDIRNLFDETGTLKPIHVLTEEQSRTLASYRVSKRGCRIRLWDKLKALDILCRHLGLFSERSAHTREAPQTSP